jgi:hypothetical protein
MADFDVEAFVAKFESLGVKLTAVPLADGRVRINRWRMPNAVDALQIEHLWAAQIGTNQARIDLLATHLAPTPAKVTGSVPLSVRAVARAGETDAKPKDRPEVAAPGSTPVRPFARTGHDDTNSKGRSEMTAGSLPVRPLDRTGEGDAKSKNRPDVTAAGSMPVRPPARAGEGDVKSRDRPTGRPGSVGPSASPAAARPPLARRNV